MRYVLAVLALLVSCQRPVVYQEVRIPVAVPCPEPPAQSWPHLPYRNITADTPPDEVVRAYVLSVRILEIHLQQTYTLLDGYRRPSPIKGNMK